MPTTGGRGIGVHYSKLAVFFNLPCSNQSAGARKPPPCIYSLYLMHGPPHTHAGRKVNDGGPPEPSAHACRLFCMHARCCAAVPALARTVSSAGARPSQDRLLITSIW